MRAPRTGGRDSDSAPRCGYGKNRAPRTFEVTRFVIEGRFESLKVVGREVNARGELGKEKTISGYDVDSELKAKLTGSTW